MIYRVEDKRLISAVMIQFRYLVPIIFALSIVLLIDWGLGRNLSRNYFFIVLIVLFITLFKLGSNAWSYYKNCDSDFIELNHLNISINYMSEHEIISLNSIKEISIYNLFGNKLLLLICEGASHEIIINDYNGNIRSDLSMEVGKHRMKKASLVQTINYLISSH